MLPPYYLERVLFVVGEPDAGKSKQLRSMFSDIRFGTGGKIPKNNKVPELYRLSNERCLYLRLTSPHEMGESPDRFLKKTARKISANTPRLGKRWNFACPLQPRREKHMPDIMATCRIFVRYFHPERTRIVFLNPNRRGEFLEKAEQMVRLDKLLRIPSVEICSIDARDRTANGLLLADFFDFT